MILAKDIMSEDIEVIYEDMLVREVAHLMMRDRVSGFPVVDRSGTAGMVGIITMTDLFSVLGKTLDVQSGPPPLQSVSSLKNLCVRDVMTRKVISIPPSMTLDEIIHLVVHNGIHFFPVMDESRMVGIVSRHDILNAVFSYD
ncbi:MAG TPA: CBS domain-containing protein [Candidatus Omnitrophota bacterium]|nr:CBS domain-containing protein [Candidatus Omnitrophota bacterium]